MLIDATHPEETRVAVISGNKLEEYDYENIVRKQLKGNIYLVKVTRVEPSLQAAFVDFGGNRHGFLPFPEIHPDYYRIPIADREALIAEERALAAEEAARADAEDEAELAAQGHSLDDLDAEDEESDEEPTAPAGAEPIETVTARQSGSIAEEISQTVIVDTSEDEDEEEDGDNEEEDSTDEIASPAEEQSAEEDSDENDEDEDDEDDDEEDDGDDEDDEEEDEEHASSEVAAEAPTPTEGDDGRRRHGHRRHGRKRDHRSRVETVGGDVVETPLFRSSLKRRYKIQEVIKRNQIMLIQISKEERGNKGAAVTSYISLPGRYCVLMPNSPRGGGVSRKVSNAKDRQRLKKILHELNVPEGMSVILRTAGVARSKVEIKRDLDYLLRLWDQIRELTLQSTAPALIYEEGNLIKRAIRDLYRRDIDEVHVAGHDAYQSAAEFMQTLMPVHVERVHEYKEENMPLFFRYQVENQIAEIHTPTVHLKSGGYIVINPTEAMVSIDVNSGRATKGRHIEETALKTNLEAADEIARQLRLRDQGGLVVIDFIDMEDRRNNRAVERRLRDAMAGDRARIQLGRISAFGLMELSRQRLHPSLVETNFEVCPHCEGTGLVRTIETTGVIVLRALEEEGLRGRAAEIKISVPSEIALYIFNHKRDMLSSIEKRYAMHVSIHADDTLIKPHYKLDVLRAAGQQRDTRPQRPAPVKTVDMSDMPLTEADMTDDSTAADDEALENGARSFAEDANENENRGRDRGERNDRRGRRGRRHGRDRDDRHHRDRDNRHRGERHENRNARPQTGEDQPYPTDAEQPHNFTQGDAAQDGQDQPRAEHPRENGDERQGRRRGRRGGRRRGRGRGGRDGEQQGAPVADGSDFAPHAAQADTPQPAHDNENGTAHHHHDHHGHEHSHHHDGDDLQAAVGGDAPADGKNRKGWWKRLTE